VGKRQREEMEELSGSDEPWEPERKKRKEVEAEYERVKPACSLCRRRGSECQRAIGTKGTSCVGCVQRKKACDGGAEKGKGKEKKRGKQGKEKEKEKGKGKGKERAEPESEEEAEGSGWKGWVGAEEGDEDSAVANGLARIFDSLEDFRLDAERHHADTRRVAEWNARQLGNIAHYLCVIARAMPGFEKVMEEDGRTYMDREVGPDGEGVAEGSGSREKETEEADEVEAAVGGTQTMRGESEEGGGNDVEQDKSA
jgi:hypothetical protein